MDVSVVVPFYNEAGNVGIVSGRVLDVLRKRKIDGELVLVDDGSTDGSLEECREYTNKGLARILSHEKNQGKDMALHTGFKSARGRVIVTLDGDGQHDPAEIPRFMEAIEAGSDLVVGKRNGRSNKARFYSWFLSSTMGLPDSDYTTGYMAMTRKCAKQIGPTLEEMGKIEGVHRYFVPSAFFRGLRVAEVEVSQKERLSGKSKMETSPLPYLAEYMKFWRYHVREILRFNGKNVNVALTSFVRSNL